MAGGVRLYLQYFGNLERSKKLLQPQVIYIFVSFAYKTWPCPSSSFNSVIFSPRVKNNLEDTKQGLSHEIFDL